MRLPDLEFNDEKAITRLLEVLHYDEPEVRKVAVQALADLNCCFDAILKALDDGNTWVRVYTTRAVGRSSDPRAPRLKVPCNGIVGQKARQSHLRKN